MCCMFFHTLTRSNRLTADHNRPCCMAPNLTIMPMTHRIKPIMAITVAAVAMGACMVERHITLDRSLWGSDQAASLEPHAFVRLVRDIRAIEQAMGDGVKRILPEEVPIANKLRRVPA